MNKAVRKVSWWALTALLVMATASTAVAEEYADDQEMLAAEGAGAADEQSTDLQWMDAGQRSPFFVDADVGGGPRFGLSSSWDTSMALGYDVRAGLGMWRGERMALFGNVGVISRASREVERHRATGTITERISTIPVRVGAKINLRPRPSWMELNLIGAGSLAVGSRKLLTGGGSSASTVVASSSIFSLGAGGGVELAMVKFKTVGVTLKGEYYFQPTRLDDEAGFMTGGFTDLGGATLSMGVVYFLGGPR